MIEFFERPTRPKRPTTDPPSKPNGERPLSDREQKLQKALEWLINLHEDDVNRTVDYCEDWCPVRDQKTDCCPADLMDEYELDGDIYLTHNRDFKKCMELQVEYYVENAQ